MDAKNFVTAEPMMGDILTVTPVNVSQATTVPADRASAALFLKAVTVFIGALAALAAYYGSKVSGELALVAFLLVFGVLGFAAWRFTVIVASGNYAAKREIDRRWKAEVQRLEMAYELHAMHLTNQRRQSAYTYRLEMRRLEHEGLRLRYQLTGPETVKGYVAAEITPVREAVMAWLFDDPGIYGADGRPNPAYVEPDGKLVNHTIPWSTRGPLKGATARAEAVGILQPSGAAPVVTYSERDKSWRLNLDEYAGADKVRQTIGAY